MTIPEELAEQVREYGMGPQMAEMPTNTLKDKWINGPTAAHRIEEIHTPLNMAYITCSTGTSSFQNIIGVTFPELPARIQAGQLALQRAGIRKGAKLLFSYPPLVNVLYKDTLKFHAASVFFPERPSRDALLAALVNEKPEAVFGEASFLLAALRDAQKMGIAEYIPKKLILIAAGTPFLPALQEEVEKLPGAVVHDLYGCQEYGALCLDGIPLREDLVLLRTADTEERFHLLVGGMPTGDTFLIGSHMLDAGGHILTYTGYRAEEEPICTVKEVTVNSRETAVRAARSALRLKGHLIRIDRNANCQAKENVIEVADPESDNAVILRGPGQTGLWGELLEAQKELQAMTKIDPVWNKRMN